MNYQEIKEALEDHKETEFQKWSGFPVGTLVEVGGIKCRVKLLRFDEGSGLVEAHVRKGRSDTWITCGNFLKPYNSSATQAIIHRPQDLKKIKDVNYIYTIQHLEGKIYQCDSLSKRKRLQDCIDFLRSKCTHELEYDRDDIYICKHCELLYEQE